MSDANEQASGITKIPLTPDELKQKLDAKMAEGEQAERARVDRDLTALAIDDADGDVDDHAPEYLEGYVQALRDVRKCLHIPDTRPVRTASQERADTVAWHRERAKHHVYLAPNPQRVPDMHRHRMMLADWHTEAADAIEAGTHERGER